MPHETTTPHETTNLPTLSDIRDTCLFVAQHSQHVYLNYDNLTTFAETITAPPEHWLITNPHNLLSLPLPLLVTILLYFEVIDYSFWPDPAQQKPQAPITTPEFAPQKWTIQTPTGPLDGSVALLYLLITNFQQNPSLDFATFSNADFYNFFHSISTLGEIPLLAERSATLRETSHILDAKLNNNFYSSIKNFTSDEQLFHFLITTFPSLRDQRTYTSHTIHFYKLAQLLTSDLLFVRSYLEHISVDTQNLPGCADYKIPQTLRTLNLISYDQELSAFVDTQQLLPENSPYEVEIRATTVAAINFLHQKLPQFSPIQINDYLFLAPRNLPKKQPYHLTRTTNY